MSSEGQRDQTSRQAVTAAILLATRWNLLRKDDTCAKLAQALLTLAQAAHGEGSTVEAEALQFLAALSGMGVDKDSGRGPFQPFMTTGDKRSLVPEDLSSGEISAIISFCTTP